MQMAFVNFRKIKIHFSEKKLSITFFEQGSAHAQTAFHLQAPTVRNALQGVETNRAHAPHSTRLTTVWCSVRRGEASTGKIEVHFFRKELKLTFLTFDLNIYTRRPVATQPWHALLYARRKLTERARQKLRKSSRKKIMCRWSMSIFEKLKFCSLRLN